MPTVVFMPISWPQEKFVDYIEALRIREGFRTTAEMMRAAGLDPSLHTNWRKGKQPTMATLDKLALALGVSPTALYLKAGHLKESDLRARGEVDFTILPQEILDLIELYNMMTTGPGRRQLLEQIDIAVRGWQARLSEPELPEARPARKRVS